ncbi:hypothetical protein [Kribbella sp. NPDC051137]|uniref:hypothetical protein n=1 Tax=Kribbella sp. NPDC051137 TaxID=3155045 RepID=UPI0034235078
MNHEPRRNPHDPATAARNDWLGTALGAFLLAALLLYIARGKITNLDGVAAITCLAAAITSTIHGFRRTRQIRQALTTKQPLPSAAGAVTLVAFLATTTALLALIAMVVHR